MTTEASSVRLSLSRSEFRIDIPLNSDLLSATHRVFFTGLLGFDFDKERVCYSQDASLASPEIIKEVLNYLEDLGVPLDLDETLNAIVSSAQQNERRLKRATAVGSDLKESPPKAIRVAGLKRPLKTYQVPAVAHMVQVDHAANFSVPGSGKTCIVLSAFAVLRRREQVDVLVVIGPRACFQPWEEEFAACFGVPPKSLRIVGTKDSRKSLYREANDYELILLTYQMGSNDAVDLSAFLRRRRAMLVVDESHNIKRFAGGKWAEAMIRLAPLAKKRVILTGTPMPNTILDLWSQMTFLWPHEPILGPREQFRSKAIADPLGTLTLTRSILSPLYWRIRKSQLGLPTPRLRRISVPMNRYQAAIYRALAAKVLADVAKAPEERAELRAWRRARMVRLLQAASNPSLLTAYSDEFRVPPLDASNLPVAQIIRHYPDYETPNKISAAEKLVRGIIKRGHKAIVWTAFVHNIRTLETSLADLSPAVVYGAIPRDESEDEAFNRERIIQAFKTDADCRVLIANPGACAESISLHNACRHAVYLDRTFNAAHYMQSLDRIHRIGLKPRTTVYYYILQSEGTIDGVIDQRLEEKIEHMHDILNDEFAVLDLETEEEEFTEESAEATDFEAVLESLKRESGRAE